MHSFTKVAVAAVICVPAAWFAYEKGHAHYFPSIQHQCEPDDDPQSAWPDDQLANWDNKFPTAVSSFLGVETGMTVFDACQTLYDQGFGISSAMRFKATPLSEPDVSFDYMGQLHFGGEQEVIGLGIDHFTAVTLRMGSPSVGLRVENLEIEYVFADQESKKPALDVLRAGLVDRFGEPSVNFGSFGRVDMYWLITESGLSDEGFEEACGFNHTADSTLYWLIRHIHQSDPVQCSAILHASFGVSTDADAPKTVSFMDLQFYDNVRSLRNRTHEDAISAQLR